ncbi:hypothetical protein DFH09DRAFT_1079803 [Mycena vulgaris]|nr:hypothetical protein DFH09DRAFT_1079803 [Mycena vulgaris]
MCATYQSYWVSDLERVNFIQTITFHLDQFCGQGWNENIAAQLCEFDTALASVPLPALKEVVVFLPGTNRVATGRTPPRATPTATRAWPRGILWRKTPRGDRRGGSVRGIDGHCRRADLAASSPACTPALTATATSRTQAATPREPDATIDNHQAEAKGRAWSRTAFASAKDTGTGLLMKGRRLFLNMKVSKQLIITLAHVHSEERTKSADHPARRSAPPPACAVSA